MIIDPLRLLEYNRMKKGHRVEDTPKQLRSILLCE